MLYELGPIRRQIKRYKNEYSQDQVTTLKAIWGRFFKTTSKGQTKLDGHCGIGRNELHESYKKYDLRCKFSPMNCFPEDLY